MKHPWKILAATLGLILVPALSATLASAQCGAPAIKASFNTSPFVAGAHFKTAAFLKTNDHDDWREASLEPIVGLWKISFIDKAASYSDTGYAAWHSDFTEFQNSERTPSTGAVCQGVWEKIAPRTYKLNHYALAYGDSVNLTNVIRIREQVVVSPGGDKFTGTFITDIYDTNHNFLVEYAGPITGTRITIDSGIDTQ